MRPCQRFTSWKLTEEHRIQAKLGQCERSEMEPSNVFSHVRTVSGLKFEKRFKMATNVLSFSSYSKTKFETDLPSINLQHIFSCMLRSL